MKGTIKKWWPSGGIKKWWPSGGGNERRPTCWAPRGALFNLLIAAVIGVAFFLSVFFLSACVPASTTRLTTLTPALSIPMPKFNENARVVAQKSFKLLEGRGRGIMLHFHARESGICLYNVYFAECKGEVMSKPFLVYDHQTDKTYIDNAPVDGMVDKIIELVSTLPKEERDLSLYFPCIQKGDPV